MSDSKNDMPGGQRQYLWSHDQLLAPEVGAVEIGKLEAGKYAEVRERMIAEATARGVANPAMIVDLIFKEGAASVYGSTGQPYPIAEFEWEDFVKDVPAYCGDNVPSVYMVDGDRYTAPI